MAGDVLRVLTIQSDRAELRAALKGCDFSTSQLSRIGWEAYRRGDTTRYYAILLTNHGGYVSHDNMECLRKAVPYRWKGRDTGRDTPKVIPDA